MFSCGRDKTDAPDEGFLASELDALGTIDLSGFTIPSSYDITGSFALENIVGNKKAGSIKRNYRFITQ